MAVDVVELKIVVFRPLDGATFVFLSTVSPTASVASREESCNDLDGSSRPRNYFLTLIEATYVQTANQLKFDRKPCTFAAAPNVSE